MVYGEGWNMPTALDNSIKTTMDNALSLPKISFFNDVFRDITKGATGESEFYKRGYLTGDLSYCEGFKFAFMGCCINYIFNKKFLSANQSINYVECHDNGTLYDKIVACGYEEEKDVLRILKLINAVVLFSFGIPFFHMGQEIGLSKNMHQNTYNKGDKYNKMRWNIVDERYEYVSFLASLIKYRKNNKFLREFDADKIDKNIDIVNLKNNVLKITYFDGMIEGKKKNIFLIINPTNEVFYYNSGKTLSLIAGDGG
jgi:pullulanase